mgnify:CR=1 FL=1
MHDADGSGLALGPPTGYVVRFTNGLTAYLTGDTGIHTEMKTVVNEFHKVHERVFAVNDLNNAAAVLGWDQATYMPPGGAP